MSTARDVHRRTSCAAPLGLVVALVVAACGVQGHAVDVPVTRPTLFPPDYTTAPTTSDNGVSTSSVSTTTTKPPRPMPVVAKDGTPRAVITATGVVAAVASVRADGAYVVVSPCGNQVAVTKATPVYGANVVLDPGHGGVESGAVGPTGLKESDLNLAVAQAVKTRLEAAGATVLLTRNGDTYMTLGSRTRVATSVKPDAFVSIHHNAAPNHDADTPGSEVYYQADDEKGSKRLAGLIEEEVRAALGAQKIRWGWFDDAGVKVRLNDRGSDYYGILRGAAGVSTALAELSYISAPAEEALLRTPSFQQVEAGAVARAIVRFLTTDDPGSGFVGPSQRKEEATGGGPAGCVEPALS